MKFCSTDLLWCLMPFEVNRITWGYISAKGKTRTVTVRQNLTLISVFVRSGLDFYNVIHLTSIKNSRGKFDLVNNNNLTVNHAFHTLVIGQANAFG